MKAEVTTGGGGCGAGGRIDGTGGGAPGGCTTLKALGGMTALVLGGTTGGADGGTDCGTAGGTDGGIDGGIVGGIDGGADGGPGNGGRLWGAPNEGSDGGQLMFEGDKLDGGSLGCGKMGGADSVIGGPLKGWPGGAPKGGVEKGALGGGPEGGPTVTGG